MQTFKIKDRTAAHHCNDKELELTYMDNYDLQGDIAKRIFLEYDQELIVRKFRLEADNSYIYLTYLSTHCRICRKTGRIDACIGQNW